MDNLTSRQERLLDKISPPLEKFDYNVELARIGKFYVDVLMHEEDDFIHARFRKNVESYLYFILLSDYRFQELSEFKELHLQRVEDYVEDYYDISQWKGIDGIKELAKDYLEECILEQNQILDGAFKLKIEIKDRAPLNVMQFVSEEFLGQYKNGVKRKIKFLSEELESLSGAFNTEEKTDVNPYPDIFKSFDIYTKFIEYTSKHIIDFYIDYSYLKKRLEHEKFIHITKDNEFMRIVFEDMKLIKQKQYDDYVVKNKLISLKKSTSANRENNFNNIFA